MKSSINTIIKRFFGLFALLILLLTSHKVYANEEIYPLRWVYYSVNFQVNDSVDSLIEVIEEASGIGFNGVVITDYKFGRIKDRPEIYYHNLERTKQAADETNMEIIPVVMSPSILINDPNMVEGIPVKNCRFVVQDGEATVMNTKNLLPGGNFEVTADENTFTDWDWIDGPGKSSFIDTEVRYSGKSAIRMEQFTEGNEYGNCRIHRKLALKPWTQYRVHAFIKTQDVSPAQNIKIAILGSEGRSLNHRNLGVKSTQNWTEYNITFNSLDNESVRFYMGIWAGKRGKIWIDDLSMMETGGVNLVRREGCPVKVTNEDGTVEYIEGEDFEKWIDPKSGNAPWPGSFEDYHTPPPIVITKNSKIREGEILLVSFYHTAIIYWGAVFPCLLNEDLFTYYREQILDLNKYLNPRKYFMAHDEIRVAGWCETCRKAGTVGKSLALHIKRCTELISSINHDADILVWSDMFDPYHNAKKHPYYLCATSFDGSWEGLDSSVIIVNWNSGKRDSSMPFFAQRGHRQIIAGYYDSPDVETRLVDWLTVADKVDGVIGAMYTTWQSKYDHMEIFHESLNDYILERQ
jgi:hypothetical protein